MELTSKKVFNEINAVFSQLLTTKVEEEIECQLNKFRTFLSVLDTFPEKEIIDGLKKEEKLIIEIFQFRRVANNSVWSVAPRVRELISPIISTPSQYEKEFRKEVEQLGLGSLLGYIE